MDEEIEMIMEQHSSAEYVLTLLNIHRELVDQGIEVPQSFTDMINKELIILAIDTDKTYTSVCDSYKKEIAKATLSNVIPIK